MLILKWPAAWFSHCTNPTSTPLVTSNQQNTFKAVFINGTAPPTLQNCHVCNDGQFRCTQHGNFAVVLTSSNKKGRWHIHCGRTCNAFPPELQNSTSRDYVFIVSQNLPIVPNNHFNNITTLSFWYISLITSTIFLLRLTTFLAGCPTALTRCRHGWKATDWSSTRPRLKSSGVLQCVASTRCRPVQFALAIRQCFRCPQSGILVSTWTPTSLWRHTSLLSRDRVSRHWDRCRACGVLYLDTPYWLWSVRSWSARSTTAAPSWPVFPVTNSFVFRALVQAYSVVEV